MRQSYAEVLATQRRLQNQKEQSDKMAEDWYRRAEMAVEKGDDELAKEALSRRQAAITKVGVSLAYLYPYISLYLLSLIVQWYHRYFVIFRYL